MPKWMPLVGGMVAFVLVTLGLILWLMFGESTGTQRGLVVTNLRTAEVVVAFDDNQRVKIASGESETLFAIKADFPQAMRVTNAEGRLLFEQRVEYQALSEAEFRIAIADDRIVFPVKLPGS